MGFVIKEIKGIKIIKEKSIIKTRGKNLYPPLAMVLVDTIESIVLIHY